MTATGLKPGLGAGWGRGSLWSSEQERFCFNQTHTDATPPSDHRFLSVTQEAWKGDGWQMGNKRRAKELPSAEVSVRVDAAEVSLRVDVSLAVLHGAWS